MTQLKRKPDGLGRSKTYMGKVSVPAKAPRQIGDIEGVNKAEAMNKLTMPELKFLHLYVQTGTATQAMLALFPKLSGMAAHRKANRWMKSIDSKISLEEKFSVMGVTTGKLARVINDAMDAKFRKEFVTRDGVIVAGQDHEDHQIRMDAARLGAKMLGLDKEQGEKAISINIINYAPEGAPRWPTHNDSNPEIDITPENEI